MADTFNGSTIVVQNAGTPRNLTADAVITHIPGGNTTIIDQGGNNLTQLTLTLFFAMGTDAYTFETQLNQVGTLSIYEGTFTALLYNIRRQFRSVSANAETTIEADFYILA